MGFKYRILVPSGNTTALVVGLESDADKRRKIQDWILHKHPDVEQVGFVSEGSQNLQLTMTGGEFCGNATRSAAYYFLKGNPGTISIQVSGVKNPLEAGITETHKVWSKMPVHKSTDNISEIEDGLYFVAMEGISHLVVSQRRSLGRMAAVRQLDGGSGSAERRRRVLRADRQRYLARWFGLCIIEFGGG